jgi:hypothetical protein
MEKKPMNISSFPEQSTKISKPFVDQTKLLTLEVKPKEKLIGGPLNIVEKQENRNEMN